MTAVFVLQKPIIIELQYWTVRSTEKELHLMQLSLFQPFQWYHLDATSNNFECYGYFMNIMKTQLQTNLPLPAKHFLKMSLSWCGSTTAMALWYFFMFWRLILYNWETLWVLFLIMDIITVQDRTFSLHKYQTVPISFPRLVKNKGCVAWV